MRVSVLAAAVFAAALSAVALAPAAAAPVVAQATAAPSATAAGTSSLSGHVTDARGVPLAGATVSAEGAGHTYTATTANDGSFTISLPPGLYTVTINHGGFQAAQNDVAVPAGTGISIDVPLTEQNLQSLRVIGRTSVSYNRTPFNISESSISTLPPVEIALRENNNLTDTVATIPGVVAQRTFSATPNTNFAVRGLGLQTRVTLDGHPISSGISGQWNTNYAAPGIFQDVEVVKGAGLNGSIAGESAVGTVNLRTRDFTRTNAAYAQLGTDSYTGGFYNVWADLNFFNDRASILVQKAFVGYNGPWNDYFGDRAGATNTSSLRTATGQVPSLIGLDQWQGDFSNRYSLEAELVKMRYRFSESSSITLEYLGLQGQYQPQGGSYAAYLGNMTLQACENGSVFQPTLATCTSQSTYTAPYTFSKIGQVVQAYTWFPNSFIQNNEPTLAAELRTSIKNDTVLFRPYTHLINRFISGTWENHYPGNGGAWYAVTNVSNCQPLFVAPGANGGPATGAAGPCFPVTTGPNSPAYVGNSGPPVQFKTTPTAPVCSPTPPYTCFTTKTGLQNDGTVGFSTPFSQPELDRLNGYTFSYIHPVANNVYNFSYDYRKDFSQSRSSDTSAAAPGCTYVIGAVTGAAAHTFQPNCSTTDFAAPYTSYNQLPRSSIGTPPTVTQYQDLALTGTFQLGDRLRLALGNYFEIYRLNAQIENPAVLAAYAALGNSAASPVALITGHSEYSHYDPHGGLEYRVNRNLSVRASAGSSITQPYPALVSGFGSITIPNAAQNNYVNTIPNFNLKPETTVAYDVGLDQRLGDGGVFSMDLYDDTIHDVFLSNTTNLGTIPGICGPNQPSGVVLQFPSSLCLQTNQINGPIQRAYGAEFQFVKNPAVGFGYYLSGTLERTYLDQLPLSIYFSNTKPTNGNFNVDGAQIFGFPFFKTYAQVFYNDVHGNTFEFGADYEGQNNYTFGPPYTVYDAAIRVPIVPNRIRLQISAQNIFGLNTGTGLGRSLSNQGNIEPTVWLNPLTGTLQAGNSSIYNVNGTTNINALPPRSFRFSLDYAI